MWAMTHDASNALSCVPGSPVSTALCRDVMDREHRDTAHRRSIGHAPPADTPPTRPCGEAHEGAGRPACQGVPDEWRAVVRGPHPMHNLLFRESLSIGAVEFCADWTHGHTVEHHCRGGGGVPVT